MADIEGFDSLLKKMEAMTRVCARDLVVKALREGAEPVRKEAQRLAPRGDEPFHAADTMMVSIADRTADGAIAKIGPSKKGFYLGQQETGNRNHAAQPHLRPALDSKQGEAEGIIGRVLADGIEKAARS